MLKAKVEAPDDLNPQETSEWFEALDESVDQIGPDRANYLLERLMEHASNLGVHVRRCAGIPHTSTPFLPRTRWRIPATGRSSGPSKA